MRLPPAGHRRRPPRRRRSDPIPSASPAAGSRRSSTGGCLIVDARRRQVRSIPGVRRARVVAVSGSSLLVQSDDPARRGSVSSSTAGAVQTDAAADGAWFPRIGGGWWVATDAGLTSGSTRVVPPDGVVVLAEVNAGFVVAPTTGGALAVWDPQSGATRAGSCAEHAVPRCRCESGRAGRPALAVVDHAHLLDRHRRRGHRARRHRFRFRFPISSCATRCSRPTVAAWRSGARRASRCTTPRLVAALRTLTAARLATLPLHLHARQRARSSCCEEPEPYRQVVVLGPTTGGSCAAGSARSSSNSWSRSQP